MITATYTWKSTGNTVTAQYETIDDFADAISISTTGDYLTYVKLAGSQSSSYSMAWLFEDQTDLVTIDLSGLDMTYVTSLNGTFVDCSSLTTLTFSPTFTANLRPSFVDTWKRCSSLLTLDLSMMLQTPDNFYEAWYGCSSLKKIDMRNADFTGVQGMSYMCYDCTSLEEFLVNKTLTLKNLITSGNFSMGLAYAFYNCSKLKHFDTSHIERCNNLSYAFYNTAAMDYIDLSSLDGKDLVSINNAFEGTGASIIDITNLTNKSLFKTSFYMNITTSLYLASSTSYYWRMAGYIDITPINNNTISCSLRMRRIAGTYSSSYTLTRPIILTINGATLTIPVGTVIPPYGEFTSPNTVNVTLDSSSQLSITLQYYYQAQTIRTAYTATTNAYQYDGANMFANCPNLTTIYSNWDWKYSLDSNGSTYTKNSTINQPTNMFTNSPRLVGAVSYNSSQVGASMANATNGYFTRKCSARINDKPLKAENLYQGVNSLSPVKLAIGDKLIHVEY